LFFQVFHIQNLLSLLIADVGVFFYVGVCGSFSFALSLFRLDVCNECPHNLFVLHLLEEIEVIFAPSRKLFPQRRKRNQWIWLWIRMYMT